MSERHKILAPGKTISLFRAIKAAGYNSARIIHYPDGRVELVGEERPQNSEHEQPPKSPFEQWEMENANTS